MAKVASVPLSEVAEINPPVSDKVLEDPGLRVSFVPMSAVSETTASVISPEERVAGDCRKSFTPFARGDVLVAKITPCFENGKIVLADIPHPFGFGSTEFHVVRARPTKLDPRFLLHALRQPVFRLKGERRMTGSAGQRRVPENFLSTFAIPLLTLDEQRRIAAILDQADALRAKRRAALKKLDELTQSIFLDMFGRPKENPMGWPLVSLMDICSPKQWPTIATAQLTATGFPVFGANGFIGYYTEYNHEKPTVLITCRGATCGAINVSPPRCYVTGNAMALDDPDLERITLEYLAAVLKLRGMADTISGTAQPQITRQNLEHVKLPLPPLNLQREYAGRSAAVEQVKSRQIESLSALDTLFTSLQNRAFRGEL